MTATWSSDAGATVCAIVDDIVSKMRGAPKDVYSFEYEVNLSHHALRRRDLVSIMRHVREQVPEAQCWAKRARPYKTNIPGRINWRNEEFVIRVERTPPERQLSGDEIALADALVLASPPMLPTNWTSIFNNLAAGTCLVILACAVIFLTNKDFGVALVLSLIVVAGGGCIFIVYLLACYLSNEWPLHEDYAGKFAWAKHVLDEQFKETDV